MKKRGEVCNLGRGTDGRSEAGLGRKRQEVAGRTHGLMERWHRLLGLEKVVVGWRVF